MFDKPNITFLSKHIEENHIDFFTLGNTMAKPSWMNGSCKFNIISFAHFPVLKNVSYNKGDASSGSGNK